jgi:hypothetical protein
MMDADFHFQNCFLKETRLWCRYCDVVGIAVTMAYDLEFLRSLKQYPCRFCSEHLRNELHHFQIHPYVVKAPSAGTMDSIVFSCSLNLLVIVHHPSPVSDELQLAMPVLVHPPYLSVLTAPEFEQAGPAMDLSVASVKPTPCRLLPPLSLQTPLCLLLFPSHLTPMYPLEPSPNSSTTFQCLLQYLQQPTPLLSLVRSQVPCQLPFYLSLQHLSPSFLHNLLTGQFHRPQLLPSNCSYL